MTRALTFFLLLAACGAEEPGAMTNGAAAPGEGEPDRRIRCRVDGATAFERVCSAEWSDGPDGRILILRKPDGGFRRLLRRPQYPFYVAADGAERANVLQLRHGVTEISIGGDRFRLP